jgi:hypothetical protein
MVMLAALVAASLRTESRTMEQAVSDCRRSLRALADGHWDAWRGLPAGCTRADVEAGLGPSEAGPDGTGLLDGTLTAFRRYPPSGAAPYGVQVWFHEREVYGVEVVSPTLARSFIEMLGEPDVKESSGMGGTYTQWIYTSRGLALHVNAAEAVVRAYGFAPCTVEAFRQLPWGRIEVRRQPLRPR